MNAQFQPVLALLVLLSSHSAALGQFSLLSIANTNNGGLAAGVAVSGNNVYLANGADGLRIYDVSSPTNPVNIYHTNTGQFAFGVTISGHCGFQRKGTPVPILYGQIIRSNPGSGDFSKNWSCAFMVSRESFKPQTLKL